MANRKERRAERSRRRIESTATLASADKIFGSALERHQAGDLNGADRLYREALAIDPNHARSLQYLGILAHQAGDSKTALQLFDRALSLNDSSSECHYNAAIVFTSLNRLDDAIAHNRRAVALSPDYADAHNNLAAALLHKGQIDEALVHYRRALELQPQSPNAYVSLANALLIAGEPDNALSIIIRGLAVKATDGLKTLFVRCASRLAPATSVDGLRELLMRAIAETWSRPADFVSIGVAVVKQNKEIRGTIEKPGDVPLRELSADPLLRTLLENAPIHDIEMEVLLTRARRAMLSQAAVSDGNETEDSTAFIAAIAQQCFITEYVYATDKDEMDAALSLRDGVVGALNGNNQVSAFRLATIAAYLPLNSIDGADRLADRAWHPAIRQLIEQQIVEPKKERELRSTIPALTTITDSVSVLVRDQYEQNPYPRWVKTSYGQPIHINEHLARLFPHSALRKLQSDRVDILIAGCGTGQHSIETAARFADASVLAIDISLTSLSYAKRKSLAAGLKNLDYAQADILKIGGIGRDFDVIEASGVLHHLRDPAEGLRALLSILRPDGLMRIALYSAHARKDVTAARDYIIQRGYDHGADAIRQCRQDIIAADGDRLLKSVTSRRDFSTLSGCRDLIFHAQEHQFTIPEIAQLLAGNRLSFLGFEAINNLVVDEYLRQFPDDRSMTNLSNWDRLENEYPTMFGSMYQFWVQRQAA